MALLGPIGPRLTRPNPGSQGSVVESLVSLRLEGSIQETSGVALILSPKHPEMTAGLLLKAKFMMLGFGFQLNFNLIQPVSMKEK